jgi:hypothetical protein
MQTAKLLVGVGFLLGLDVPRVCWADEPTTGTQAQPTILAAHADDVELLRRSRVWYILSRDNGYGLLHGLPQRLGKAIVPSRRKEPMWQGVDDGASIKLVIEREGDADGEIFVGFFSDPRWWLAEPVQVRSFDEPGNRLVCRVDRLPPGKYWLGAMIGGLPHAKALGVHRTWPSAVEVGAGQPTIAELRVSPKFTSMIHPDFEQGFAGQWLKMDPTRTVTVRTVDKSGKPLPFCHVALFERDPHIHARIRPSGNSAPMTRAMAFATSSPAPLLSIASGPISCRSDWQCDGKFIMYRRSTNSPPQRILPSPATTSRLVPAKYKDACMIPPANH